jgi:hypothetical protein
MPRSYYVEISSLKIGDKVQIQSIPGESSTVPIFLHEDTRIVYEKIIKRGTPVRISKIDEYGQPWYNVKFKENTEWEFHSLSITSNDKNWIKVEKRNENAS